MNTRTRGDSFHKAIVGGTVIYMYATLTHALPVLNTNSFFGSSALFSTTAWSYTGTLPSANKAGFRARNIDNDFFGDSGTQYTTGSRTMDVTTGNSPSYSLAFRGEFEPRVSEAWDNSLLSQSSGVRQEDIDAIAFDNPGTGVTNEHPIPAAWRGLNGYASPTGAYAQFNKTFTLSLDHLNPGQGGCPLSVPGRNIPTGQCLFSGAYFKGGVNLQASLQGYGSIQNVVIGAQSVAIDAKANRITNFLVNSNPIYSGQINGTAASFNLEEEKVSAVNFGFTGNFQQQSISATAGIQWDGSGDTSSLDASYVRRVDMPDYVSVGKSNQYVVAVRDAPQLSAGIVGKDFYQASVLASTGLSAIDALLLPVFEAFASSRLMVNNATTWNIEKNPEIPSSGFKQDWPIHLTFLLSNNGDIDLTLDKFNYNLIDQDFASSDDTLLAFNRNLNYVIHPNSTLRLAFDLLIPQTQLNTANDFLEGRYFELSAFGSFLFHDIYGAREERFTTTMVPEPSPALMLVLGVFIMSFFDKLAKWKINGIRDQ